MRAEMLDALRCPRCHHEHLDLTVEATDGSEVRTATLTCQACAQQYGVRDGIVDLLFEPPDFVRREAAGLERFAEVMRADGWGREKILALPHVALGYWVGQSAGIEALLDREELEPGRRLLDVGSNTCWASNIFAQRGLDVIALDIATTELQGLKTAEYFIEQGDVYFDRMLSVMFDPALASGSMDYVFCCEVLHHNDRQALLRTFREMYRILKPGGKLMVINEPLRFLLNLKRDHAEEVAEFEGHEHVFFLHEYYLAARRAGFTLKVHAPAFYGAGPAGDAGGMRLRDAAAARVSAWARRHRYGNRAYSLYKSVVSGDVSLSMTATKPGQLPPVGPP
jgi:SAM-dependent methyltransferase